MQPSSLRWRLLAKAASQPAVVDALIRRAEANPYYPILGEDNSLYMDRGWIFNPYDKDAEGNQTDPRWPKLASVRLHHIMRADWDRHFHDHPWDARTMVLRGWYKEARLAGQMTSSDWVYDPPEFLTYNSEMGTVAHYTRRAGYTGPLLFGQFHRITEVSPGGVHTLFWTWKYQGGWGFYVPGEGKVPWRDYLQRARAGEWK